MRGQAGLCRSNVGPNITGPSDADVFRGFDPPALADLLDLSPQQRAAMYLFDVEGYSFPEIADLLGCSADAARAAASRGRRLLAKNLTEPDGSVTT